MRARAAIFLIAAVLSGCGDEQDETVPGGPPDPGLIHIHGLGRNPADGSLMIATHTGLFRVSPEGGDPERVANRYQDTMGFTVLGPDHFLGSGHPGSVRDGPPFLGLIESRDAGSHWRPISLRGEIDFHVLEAQAKIVYGFGSDFETREPRFLRSQDSGRSWKRLSPPEGLMGLAIDPQDPWHIVATGEQRGYVSRDGGTRWRPLPIPGGLLTWTHEIGVVAVDLAGVVRTADEPTAQWTEAGRLPGSPAALEGVRDELLAGTHDALVLSSGDGGKSWRKLLGP